MSVATKLLCGPQHTFCLHLPEHRIELLFGFGLEDLLPVQGLVPLFLEHIVVDLGTLRGEHTLFERLGDVAGFVF